jgi:hypothetical protein
MFQIVGSLLWLMRISRPDICYAVCHLARNCSNPTSDDFFAASRILRYLAGTSHLGLSYTANSTTVPVLTGYVDADWAGDSDSKSQSGYMFFLCGSLITWSSKKQSIVALSSTESEVIAASSAVSEARWIFNLLSELKLSVPCPIIIYEDNQATINLSQRGVISKRNKHIDLRNASIHEHTESNLISLTKVASRDNLADIHTKALPIAVFENLSSRFMSKVN